MNPKYYFPEWEYINLDRPKRGGPQLLFATPTRRIHTLRTMFAQILTSLLLVHGLFATQLKPGQYHVVNLAHPYAPVSVDAAHSRVYVPPAFSGGHSLWDVLTPPGALDGITMHSVDAGRWAQVTPGQVTRVSVPPHRRPVHRHDRQQVQHVRARAIRNGRLPGDGGMIPDSHIDYWTIGAPDGSVWTYNPDAGSEASGRFLLQRLSIGAEITSFRLGAAASADGRQLREPVLDVRGPGRHSVSSARSQRDEGAGHVDRVSIRTVTETRTMMDDSFELYDLRVEVICPPGERILCGAKPGDHFTLEGEMLHLPPGQGFSIYSLCKSCPLPASPTCKLTSRQAAVLSLLAAKQRVSHANDWITTDTDVACPDPNCNSASA
ncbi:unnamed protein product [Mycena citricolor]|uniref:Uncharacterized protein n=1 Tax=Mycena citricolor TaxID=2018698 RepID=A0AAD2K0Z8_9AGAR|nr:unnamed protein product [Mycena citricolor]